MFFSLQVKQPWVELGGTKSGASYLESETDHASSLVALVTWRDEEPAPDGTVVSLKVPKDSNGSLMA